MTERNRLLAAAALLLGALLVVYSNHWHNSFHFDDRHTIEDNVFVQGVRNIPRFFTDASTFSALPANRAYRPVVSTTLALDYTLAQAFTRNGYDTFWYHVSTFIVFLAQGVLLFLVCRKVLEPSCTARARDWTAFVVTALYMLHPAQAETINYIIARSDSLSTFCVLAGFAAYLYLPALRRSYLYLLPIVIGSLAKPTALMFAPMLLVYQILFEERRALTDGAWMRWNVLKRGFAPACLVAAAVYVLTWRMEFGYREPSGVAMFNYVITQPWVMLHYATNFVAPLHFSADTDWQAFASVAEPRCLLGFVFLAAMIAAIVRASRSPAWRPVSFGLAWFLLALLPTSLAPLSEVMNDHRVFFPYVGLALAVVATLRLVGSKVWVRIPSGALALPVVVVLAAYGWRTHGRNAVWTSEETLWREVTIESPNNARGLMNYGYALMRRGALDEADDYFNRVLQLKPNYPILNWNMAVLQSRRGDDLAAEAYWKKALALSPRSAGLHADYALFLRGLGRKDEAIAHLQQSLAIVEANVGARRALMPLLLEADRLEELKAVAARTLEIVPGDAESLANLELAQTGQSALQRAEAASASFTAPEQWLELSLLRYRAGQFEPCIEAARIALTLKPDYAVAWNNICAAYNALGDYAEGRKAGEEAVRLDPGNALARRNLDWAIASQKGE